MKFRTFFAFLLGAGLGVAGTYYYFQQRYDKDITEMMEEEYLKKAEYEGLETPQTETVAAEPTQEDIQSDEDMAEVVIKNSVLTESAEKPDIFDYAKLSLGKIKDEKPMEKSHDPVDDVSDDIEFKMRKVNVAEFEDLTYSYEMQELTLYRDGYVTDYEDRPVYKFTEMYPDANFTDQDETGHIYVAADYMMTVYDITVVSGNYKDIYPDEETGD